MRSRIARGRADLFDHLATLRWASAACAGDPARGAASLGSIWPVALALDGVSLGDTWRHPAIVRNDETDGLMPFHKLSQWLSYSLVEPLQAAASR